MTTERYTTDRRWEILRHHMDTHGGKADPVDFLEAASNPDHLAHEWYEWDDTKAAHEHRLHQTRKFFKINIRAEDSQRVDAGDLAYTVAVVSPLETRHDPKHRGYILADTPEGRVALQNEFAASVEGWLNRRAGMLEPDQIRKAKTLIKSLRKAVVQQAA